MTMLANESRLTQSSATLPTMVSLYLLVFLVPIEFSFYVGPLLITPTRLFLALTALPVVYLSFSRKSMQAEDYFFIFLIFWIAIAYFYKRGSGAIEIVGQSFLEIAISYCIARTFLTDVKQFKALAIVLSTTVAVLGVLAIPEAVLHTRYLHEIPRLITGFYYEISNDTRLGLLRAASTFEHPILFGLFCSSLFTFAWYCMRNTTWRILHLAFTLLATIISLSSAALLILTLQLFLVTFEKLTRAFRARTIVFGTLAIVTIAFIESMSDRGVVKLIGSNLTFNPHTAYYRVLQWEHAIDDVQRHPFVGINFEQWTRPHWMTDSIDNHWLFTAMNSGLPAVFAFWAVLIIISVKLYRKKRQTIDEGTRLVCMAWLIGAASLFLGAWTVTFFGKMLPIFMFFIGMGAAATRICHDANPNDKISNHKTAIDEASSSIRYARYSQIDSKSPETKRLPVAMNRIERMGHHYSRDPGCSNRFARTHHSDEQFTRTTDNRDNQE